MFQSPVVHVHRRLSPHHFRSQRRWLYYPASFSFPARDISHVRTTNRFQCAFNANSRIRFEYPLPIRFNLVRTIVYKRTHASLTGAGDCHMTRRKKDVSPLMFWRFSQAKERAFDTEEAAKIIFFEKRQVCRRKKLIRVYRRRNLVRGSLPLLNIAATCDCSHAQQWQ